MKKIFSIFLVCCTAFAFADDPVFEETEEKVFGCFQSFAAEEPFFEETDEPDAPCCDENDANHEETDNTQASEENSQDEIVQDETAPTTLPQSDEPKNGSFFSHPTLAGRILLDKEENSFRKHQASYVSWKKYKANFGMEKIFLRFPQRPAVFQNDIQLKAYAYDYTNMYSMTGYYPPIGNIDPLRWFDENLFVLNSHPLNLISYVIFQACTGEWIMDYTTHDYMQNLILKGRAIVTPFNAYVIECVKPNGARDNFDYFLDSFWIQCECCGG